MSDKDRKKCKRPTSITDNARTASGDVAEEEDDGIYTRDSPMPRAGESQGDTTITVALKRPNAPTSAPRALPFPLALPIGPSTFHGGEVARAGLEEEKGAHKQDMLRAGRQAS